MMKLRVWFVCALSADALTPELPILPACLADTRKLAFVRQLAEAYTAQTELAIYGVGTPTTLATVLRTSRVLRLA